MRKERKNSFFSITYPQYGVDVEVVVEEELVLEVIVVLDICGAVNIQGTGLKNVKLITNPLQTII